MIYSADFLMSIRPTVKSDPELVLRIKALGLHRDQTPFFQKPRGPQEKCRWNPRNLNRESQGFNQQGQHGQAFRPRTNRRPQTPPAPKTQDSMGLESKVEAWNRSEKAWKPRKTFPTSSDPLQSKAKEIRGLLNKITPTTFGELTEKFLAENVFKNGQLLPLVVDNIFDKAVEEPSYCPLYSDLVACQVQEESRVNRSKHFLISVLSRCQKTFEAESRIAFKEKLEGLKKDIQEADNEKTKKLLQENIAKAQLKERRRVMGNIGLIAQLYRNKLVSLKILNLCIATLLKTHKESQKSDEESLECAIKLISDVGKSWEQQRSSEIRQKRLRYHVKPQVEIDLNLHGYIACLQNLAPTLSNRLSFKVLDLLDLRKNKWEPRKSQTQNGPKTLEEIHATAKKEALDNEKERAKYEKQKRDQRRGPQNRRYVNLC